jgi:hypothetical protein
MKCNARLAIAAVIGVFAWQCSWSAPEQAQQPPPQLAKSVSVDDLSNGKLADNVYVMVKVQLKSMQADIFGPSVKKMMGPQGQVIPVEEANQLILIDTVATLRDVVRTIGKVEMDPPEGGFGTLTYKCLHIRASVAAVELNEMLKNPNALATIPGYQQPAGGLPQPVGRPMRALKPSSVDYDDRTNHVFVTGSPDKVNLAKHVLVKLDVLDKQAPQGNREKSLLKTYEVPAGSAESTAEMLQQIYKSSSSLRISPVGTTQIMVYAPIADQMEIANRLKNAVAPQGVAGVFALKISEANKVASLVLDKLSKDPGAPLVLSIRGCNSIVVYGSPNQVEAVRLMIESLSGEKVQASKHE